MSIYHKDILDQIISGSLNDIEDDQLESNKPLNNKIENKSVDCDYHDKKIPKKIKKEVSNNELLRYFTSNPELYIQSNMSNKLSTLSNYNDPIKSNNNENKMNVNNPNK